MNRREFLRSAGGVTGGAAAAAGAAGTAAAQEDGNGSGGGGGSGGTPDFGGYTDDAAGGEFQDARGQDSVTVEVGAGSSGLAFAPTELWIDSGTEVTFEWVSNGHNVIPEEQPEGAGWEGSGGESELFDEGYTYSHTFETGGIYTYYCSPHKQSGMLGGIAVGGDVPTTGGGGGTATPVDPEHMGVPFQPHFVGIATLVMMVVSIVFTFFLLKYGESPHASGGND